jgi:hypothetical protein
VFYGTKLKKELKRIMRGVIVVVIRWSDGKIKNSKPCMHCLQYMKNIGIKKICYSNEEGEFVNEKIKNIETVHVCMARRILGRKIN